MLLRIFVVVVSLLGLFSAERAHSQQIGRCFDNTRGQAFDVFQNFYMVEVGNPMNQGLAVRDPSGQSFLRLPAANPFWQAFFLGWDGQVVEVNQAGVFVIGSCSFSQQIIPPNPYGFDYSAPQMANWGVRTLDGTNAVPTTFANQTQRYVRPLYTDQFTAEQCLIDSDGDEYEFGDCMLREMLAPKEEEIYECAVTSASESDLALCAIGAVGGEDERRAAEQLRNCYSEYSSDWGQYPLCLAGQNMDDDTARLLACVQKQSEQQGTVSFFGTAVCYGAGSIQLTPEQQIAIECAASSGGEPLTFAGCAGGQLTARELNKCLENGVGSHDCFGPNNEVVKALNSIGLDIRDAFGPNNDLVRTWNNGVSDLTNGPGPNNDLVQAANTIANDVANGPGPNNDIVQAIDNVLPGFSDLF